MVVNMQQITFMYGVEAAEAMIRDAWPDYCLQDRTRLDGASTTARICSERDWHGLNANSNRLREFISDNT